MIFYTQFYEKLNTASNSCLRYSFGTIKVVETKNFTFWSAGVEIKIELYTFFINALQPFRRVRFILLHSLVYSFIYIALVNCLFVFFFQVK